MLIFLPRGKHICSSSLPALSMFPCFNSDSAAQRACLPSTENTPESFPRWRAGGNPSYAKQGNLGTQVLSFPLTSFLPPVLQCWDSNPGPSACQAKALLLNPATGILVLNWLFIVLQWQLVPFPPSTGWAHSWLSSAHEGFSSHREAISLTACPSTFQLSKWILFSILSVIMAWCPKIIFKNPFAGILEEFWEMNETTTKPRLCLSLSICLSFGQGQ